MRLYRNRYYVGRCHPGISGFKRQEWEYYVVTGAKARTMRSEILGEYHPIASHWFDLDDGHLPGHRLGVQTKRALAWLVAHPYSRILPQGFIRACRA